MATRSITRVRQAAWTGLLTALVLSARASAWLVGLLVVAPIIVEVTPWLAAWTEAATTGHRHARDRGESLVRVTRQGLLWASADARIHVWWDTVSELRVGPSFLVPIGPGQRGLFVPLRGRLDAIRREVVVRFVQASRDAAVECPAESPALTEDHDDVRVEFEPSVLLLRDATWQVGLRRGFRVQWFVFYGLWTLLAFSPIVALVTSPSSGCLLIVAAYVVLAIAYPGILYLDCWWSAHRKIRAVRSRSPADRRQIMSLSPNGMDSRGPLSEGHF